jgi:hypothetical protein
MGVNAKTQRGNDAKVMGYKGIAEEHRHGAEFELQIGLVRRP